MDRKDSLKFGFDWGRYLTELKSEAAPVQLFGHAQMSSNWMEIESGVKVEVLNSDCPVTSKVYWIAQIIKVAGYKALLRYEGFGDDSSCDFWCNLCTYDVHAVGWCATVGKPLVPPKTIQFKYTNWKIFLIERLTGSKTLPNDFNDRVAQSLECTFVPKMRVEVMDKCQISRKRVGIIEEIVGGRLRLQYEDSDEANDDFWCHCSSSLIHPIGWSERIGHRILVASKDYKVVPGFKNSKPDMFVPVKSIKPCGFKVGMKLEAIDPLNLSSICVATVRKVLKNGYLMIGIDGSEAAGGTDWFCYHCTSPSIFPVGHCYSHNITLSIPNDHKNTFSWPEYLKETNSEAAPIQVFMNENIDHGFVRGMRLEAVDLMDPRLLCVATVSRVVGRLLRIHFDGWDTEYDQWIDSQSPDIFPVGWCEMLRYSLQPPPNYKHLMTSNEGNKRKTKTRTSGFAGKRKRKKLSALDKRDSLNQEDDAEDKLVDKQPDDNDNHVNETSPEEMEDIITEPVKDAADKSGLGPPEEADLSLSNFEDAEPAETPSISTLLPDPAPESIKQNSLKMSTDPDDEGSPLKTANSDFLESTDSVPAVDATLSVPAVESAAPELVVVKTNLDTSMESENLDLSMEKANEATPSVSAIESAAPKLVVEKTNLDTSMESANLDLSMEKANETSEQNSPDLGPPIDSKNLNVSEELNNALSEDSGDLGVEELKSSQSSPDQISADIDQKTHIENLILADDVDNISRRETKVLDSVCNAIDDKIKALQTEAECTVVGSNVEMSG